MTTEETKQLVRSRYREIATSVGSNGCGCGCSSSNFIGEEYDQLDGYLPEADLGLGCGIPTEYAAISEGDTVIDLGSGAGNDVFVARSIVGQSGRVIGVDFTDVMLHRAEANRQKLGYDNVQFIQGDIENLPLESNVADVVISNCVLNLVPDKAKAFSEIYRVLKPGGHFCVSDVVASHHLPEAFKRDAELYAGCIGGALERAHYLSIIRQTGFEPVVVHSEHLIDVPAELMVRLEEARSAAGLFSITISGYKK
jgi:SAM-dependent methyltransferase